MSFCLINSITNKTSIINNFCYVIHTYGTILFLQYSLFSALTWTSKSKLILGYLFPKKNTLWPSVILKISGFILTKKMQIQILFINFYSVDHIPNNLSVYRRSGVMAFCTVFLRKMCGGLSLITLHISIISKTVMKGNSRDFLSSTWCTASSTLSSTWV